MVVDDIQKNHRVDSLQRPLLPFFRYGENLVCNAAHCGIRDLYAIDVLNVILNIADSHPLGVHGQNLFLDVLTDAGLVFLQHLRLKFALAIPGHGHLHITKVGPQSLAAVTVAAVVRVLVFVVVPAVAQLIVQLGLQTIFHKFSAMVSLNKF